MKCSNIYNVLKTLQNKAVKYITYIFEQTALSCKVFNMKKMHLLSEWELKDIAVYPRFDIWKVQWIYFLLWPDKELIYIWKSKDIKKRITNHLNNFNIYFTYYSYLEIHWDNSELSDREWMYIMKYYFYNIENKNWEVDWVFIEKKKLLRKIKSILMCTASRARNIINWFFSFNFCWKEYCLKNEVKKFFQQYGNDAYTFWYDLEFVLSL